MKTAPGQYQLDFARYCKEFNGGQGPDAITIHLMVNDVFAANDETIESRIDKMFGFYDTLIKEFHKVRANTRVGVVLTAPPSQSQDGFRNYIGVGRQTRWQYRRNIHRAFERAVQQYGGREGEYIYLIPVYVNFDAEHHYPTRTATANARATESVVRVYNGTHPAPEGYQQIADSIYCWLKAMTALESSKTK